MSVALVTGSGGLIGSQATRYFASLGLDVVGVDNDMRGRLFGPEGSVARCLDELRARVPGYDHHDLDVRDRDAIAALWRKYGRDVTLVIHAAAQPAHDSADPLTDWDVNASGTANVLEATRRHAPDAVVICLSTIKVYGQHPNDLPLVERATRYEIDPASRYAAGIDETMSIDAGIHSIFGASKTAADVFAQEYGHAFGLRTVVLRPGCLTGPAHAAVEMHGFLGYLMLCVAGRRLYHVQGSGKQVRDQIHSSDVAAALGQLWRDPPAPGSVFNLGGGPGTDVSVLEALALAERIAGIPALFEHVEARHGDHRWWVTDTLRFRARYPTWRPLYDVPTILEEIHAVNGPRWRS